MSKIATSKGIIEIEYEGQRATGTGEIYITCPVCTPERKPEHKNEKKLAINIRKDPIPWRCNHCGEGGYILTDKYMSSAKIKPLITNFTGLKISDTLAQWFWDKRRIGIETLRHFDITMNEESMRQDKVRPENAHLKDKFIVRKCINFKYKMHKVLVNIKFRDPDKNFKMLPGATLIPYNIDSVLDKTVKECVITEGEIDALSYHEAGVRTVISAPNGIAITEQEREEYKTTGKMNVISHANLEWLDLVIDLLDHIETFFLATDDDPAGIKLREELARRLGYERCRYICFGEYKNSLNQPINDPNELLFEKGPEILASTLDSSHMFPITDVTTADQYLDVILKNYHEGKQKGISTGYVSLNPFFNWMRGWLYVVNGFPNMGKALDIEIDIPGPTGFKKMKDIQPGDVIYDEDGMPCNVVRATEIMYDRPCYEIEFSDHTKIKCDEEHLWFVHDQRARASRANHLRRKPRTSSTTGINQGHLMIKPKVVTTKFIYENQKSKDSNKSNFSIDCSKPVWNTEKYLPIHPYILGAWLGDGLTTGGTMTIGNQDAEETIAEFERLGYEITHRKTKYMYGVVGLHNSLVKVGLLGNKHIPEIYFTASIEQRLELLRGILDTDGTISPNGVIELSLSDDKLAHDIHTLICSLGIETAIRRNKSYLNGEHKKDRFRMVLYTDMKVFKLKRKLERLRPKINIRHKYRTILSCRKIDSIPVKCIQVDSPNKLYLASKSYIPTHNTSWVLNLMAITAVKYKWKWGIYCPENYPVSNVIELLSMILIGKPIDSGFDRRISETEIVRVVRDFIKKYFFLVDNENGFSPEKLRTIKKQLVQQHGIVGFLTDPWSSLNHDMGRYGSEDGYLQNELNHEVRLTTMYNLINIICHHPRTPKSKHEAGEPPTVFELTGGKYWWIKTYSAISLHQESYDDWKDNMVGIHVQKMKDKQRAGETTNKSNYPLFRYDKLTRRFYESSTTPKSEKRSDFDRFPFKNYLETEQQNMFEGF